ncbi:hypothetical protein BO94DRAFT_577450 [Aspergillus sclerotioniger CBS 115572]|uniref:DNA-directed RNA polymerase subunit n=1 Tax=Aspergillus sclerotioniger CBS 115572 TaxID=1450535 RepID=A0A317VWH7_9EURO|nr:hypothetical protein BO94DRAFT_577450 [Aspergillus sclerotioniger CBS 115572]PWY78135.1 hypothetical protein BO94DRAFT_577450 [Aspergillus sclerotioniger CBS 115572]
MALDAMDLDPTPTGPATLPSPEKDRKRKHKDSTSPSKKKRKHESDSTKKKSSKNTAPQSTSVVNAEDPHPQPLTLACTAGEYGVLYVYLTATFLVFRPQRGQILEGWVNVQSEGFLGAIVLNLFTVGIERKRLPPSWKWIPPGEEQEEEQQQQLSSSTEDAHEEDEEDSDSSSQQKNKTPFDPEKELFRPIALASDVNPLADTDTNEGGNNTTNDEDEDAAAEGYFQSVSGHRVRGTIKFRVVDVDVIPGSERESGFISIEGTMLDEDEERRLFEEERTGVSSLSTGMTPRRSTSASMSGALAIRSASTSAAPSPVVVDIEVESPSKKPVKEKKSKSKSKKEKSRE